MPSHSLSPLPSLISSSSNLSLILTLVRDDGMWGGIDGKRGERDETGKVSSDPLLSCVVFSFSSLLLYNPFFKPTKDRSDRSLSLYTSLGRYSYSYLTFLRVFRRRPRYRVSISLLSSLSLDL